jgi:hypothetical protein
MIEDFEIFGYYRKKQRGVGYGFLKKISTIDPEQALVYQRSTQILLKK